MEPGWPLRVDAGERGVGRAVMPGRMRLTNPMRWLGLDASMGMATGVGDRGPVRFVGEAVRCSGEDDGRQKKQGSERQKGRYGGVRTHHENLRGAERQSYFRLDRYDVECKYSSGFHILFD
jgi:hypothetical protein